MILVYFESGRLHFCFVQSTNSLYACAKCSRVVARGQNAVTRMYLHSQVHVGFADFSTAAYTTVLIWLISTTDNNYTRHYYFLLTMHSAFLGGLAASATILLVAGYFIYRRRRKEYRVVGTVSRICLFPIKSCRGIDLQVAECTTSGLQAQGLKDRYNV